MKKLHLLFTLIILAISLPIFAETIALQSFESSANDTWTFTADPASDSKRIWWGPTTEMMGGTSPFHGNYYWAGWDLDNIESTVTMATLTLDIGSTYNVSFYYYTRNLDTADDYCRYSVMYDNGTNWDDWVTVDSDSNAWTMVSVDVPPGSAYLRLRLSSKFDGTNKYAHWDYLKVECTPIPSTAPEVTNVTVSQRADGSKIIDIYYDLFDANEDLCEISFKLSDNNGVSFDIVPDPVNLSGDFGADLPGGTGKHIIWDAGSESFGLDGSFLYRVFADDNSPIPENFVWVEGGTFHNGSSDVTISSFYIDKYELTQAEYQAVMGNNPSSFTSVSNGPVENVTWFNAIEYCNRRSMQEGLTPCYSYGSYGTNPDAWPSGWNTNHENHTNVVCNWSSNGYRLPTEMEWMFAAMGGNQSQGYTYSGSNDIDAVAWYYYNSGSTNTVGTKAANELGLYDMSGNVYEWVWDIYGDYPSGTQTDPHGAGSGTYRVERGGCWRWEAYRCTVSHRHLNRAIITNSSFGFRLCRNVP